MNSILLDIEGTTTPIEFVHEVLFPFARKKLLSYIAANFESLAPQIAQLSAEHEKDLGYTDHFNPGSAKSVAEYLVFLIDADRKSTPLKSIQGKIWKEGYESGDLMSIVFDDVPRAFERWTAAEKTIAIFSSGSVLAQQLLFRYTNHGDLTRFISSYFDTNIGAKRELDSYRRIAGEVDRDSADIIFCSDIPAELDAARSVGLQTALTVREGNKLIEEDVSHRVIRTFDELE